MDELKRWQLSGYEILEIKQEKEEYDGNIDLNNCIRALWLLYRRGRWAELEQLGLVRERAQPSFERFDLLKFRGSGGLVTTETETLLFVKMCPGVVMAATKLLEAYKKKEGKNETVQNNQRNDRRANA